MGRTDYCNNSQADWTTGTQLWTPRYLGGLNQNATREFELRMAFQDSETKAAWCGMHAVTGSCMKIINNHL